MATPDSFVQRTLWTWQAGQWVPGGPTANAPPTIQGTPGQTYDDVTGDITGPLMLTDVPHAVIDARQRIRLFAKQHQIVDELRDHCLDTLEQPDVDANAIADDFATLDTQPGQDMALLFAITSEFDELIEPLLDLGASPDATGVDGKTALGLAVQADHGDYVDKLLQRGANPDLPSDGETPLIAAIDDELIDIVDRLLAGGAAPDVLNAKGLSPMRLAIELAREDIVQSLIGARANLDLIDGYQTTPVGTAITQNERDLVDLLLTSGAAVDLPDGYQKTPLLLAIESGDEDLIDTVLGHGPNLDLVSDGNTVLHQAIHDGSLALVVKLLDAGAGVDVADGSGNTPLLTAVIDGDLPIVDLLIVRGARLDQQNQDGDTALHRAVSRAIKVDRTKAEPKAIERAANAQHMVELLLEGGADRTIANQDGHVPLAKAHLLNDRVMRLLRGPYVDTLRDAYLASFKDLLVTRLSDQLHVGGRFLPGDVAQQLRDLVAQKYQDFVTLARVHAGPMRQALASMDIGAFYHQVEHDLDPSTSAKLKLLAHLFSLAGEKKLGGLFDRQDINLEGFATGEAIFHSALALQHTLRSLGDERAERLVREQIRRVYRAFERAVEIQMIDRFFAPIGMLDEASTILGLSVLRRELQAWEGFVLPAGWSGELNEDGMQSGHAVYVAGRGNFTGGTGRLSVHNLGALSGHHEENLEERSGDLRSLRPFAVERVKSNKGLAMWLADVIKANILSSREMARLTLYQDLRGRGDRLTGQALEQLPTQQQQVVGNCSVENLNNVLLTTLSDELGPDRVQEWFEVMQALMRDFAVQYAKEGADGDLVATVDRLVNEDLAVQQMIVAARRGDLATVERQVAGGVDVNATDEKGRSALTWAVQRRHADIVLYLMDNGATVGDLSARELAGLLLYDHFEAFTRVIQGGADPNGRVVGLNLLTVAVKVGRPDIVEVLLDHGADINGRNDDNTTAWNHAELKGHPEMRQLLLGRGGRSFLLALPPTQ